MDEVFRALNDPSRRLLLDALFDSDAQTLGELCAHLPAMTRFGVMNHLRVLETAHLITTRKLGRRKLHYLNPVPIRLVHDRWISKYTEPAIGGLAKLKTHIEQGDSHMSVPAHVYQVYIRCTPQAAWDALIDGEKTVQYYYSTRVESDWSPGSAIRYLSPGGDVVADGEVIAFEPPGRLEITFHARWDPELEAEGPIRMVWRVEGSDGPTSVTAELHDIDTTSRTFQDFVGGLPLIVSGLKTLLETGSPLSTA